MTALVILALAALMQSTPSDPDRVRDDAREIFRLEREAAAGRAAARARQPGRGETRRPSGRRCRALQCLRPHVQRHPAQRRLAARCLLRRSRSRAGRSAIAAPSGTPTTAAATGNCKTRASPARCGRFASSTPQTGWAAGGFSHPYVHSSAGVVLATRDGGRHWYRDPQLVAAGLAANLLLRRPARLGRRQRLADVSRRRLRQPRRRADVAAAGRRQRRRAGPAAISAMGKRASWPAATAPRPRSAKASRPWRRLPASTCKRCGKCGCRCRPFAWLVGDGGAGPAQRRPGRALRAPPPTLPRDTAP